MVSIRKGMKVIDFFSLIGGFSAFLSLIFTWIGAYFSTKLMHGAMAEKLFLKKRN
jgi:hypothetical protein